MSHRLTHGTPYLVGRDSPFCLTGSVRAWSYSPVHNLSSSTASWSSSANSKDTILQCHLQPRQGLIWSILQILIPIQLSSTKLPFMVTSKNKVLVAPLWNVNPNLRLRREENLHWRPSWQPTGECEIARFGHRLGDKNNTKPRSLQSSCFSSSLNNNTS